MRVAELFPPFLVAFATALLAFAPPPVRALDCPYGGDSSSCIYDLTTCAVPEACFNSSQCAQWVDCDTSHSDIKHNWQQNTAHSCHCPPSNRGTDCSLTSAPATAPSGTWCNDGFRWDGTFLPTRAHKKIECFLVYDVEFLLSLRLHRIIADIGPKGESVHWSLSSRHRNDSNHDRHSPHFHLCDSMVNDIDCQLESCVFLTKDRCSSVTYSCYHANCTGASSFGKQAASTLNNPQNWPVRIQFSSIDNRTATGTSVVSVGGTELIQHCTSGSCPVEPAVCGETFPNPPPDRSWVLPTAVCGSIVLVVAAVAACGYAGRRPSKRVRSDSGTTDTRSVEFHRFAELEPLSETAVLSPYAPPIGILFEDVSYNVKIGKRLSWCQWLAAFFKPGVSTSVDRRVIQGITGAIAPGELVALMGPSGAGKSSFLDILASHDKSGTVNGSVEYTWGTHRTNARPDDALSGLKHSTIPGVGYVYQDDQLLPTETVRETLLVSAQMRLPQHYSMEEIHERVDFILNAMELTAIQNSRVGSPDKGGGLSGGERKRLAIGVELLAQPRVLLLDEPTTGLDSYSASVVMKVLRATASAGCACILSIHQPTSEIFKLFDKVVVLTSNGRLAYCGAPMKAVDHVGRVSGVTSPRAAADEYGVEESKAPMQDDHAGAGAGAGAAASAGSSSRAAPRVGGISTIPPVAEEPSTREASRSLSELSPSKPSAAAQDRQFDYLDLSTPDSTADSTVGHLPPLRFRGRGNTGGSVFSESKLSVVTTSPRNHDPFGEDDDDLGLGQFELEGGILDEERMVNPAEVLLDAASAGSDADRTHLAASFRTTRCFAELERFLASERERCTLVSSDDHAAVQAGFELSSRSWLLPVSRFILLCQRGVRQMVRDLSLFATQMLLTCVVAVFIGGLFFDLKYDLNGVHNRTGVLFFNIVYFSLASMSSIGVLLTEKHTFFRERARGFYRTGPYFLSKVVVDIVPLRVIPPLLYGGIIYFMIDLNHHGARFVTFLFIMVLVNVTAAAGCYVISAFSTSGGEANLAASLYFVFNILFGGLLLTGRNKTISTIMYFSIFNFGFQATMVNEFHGLTDIKFNPKNAGVTIITGDVWLQNWGIDPVAHPHLMNTAIAILAAYAAGFLLVAFAGLAFFQRYKR